MRFFGKMLIVGAALGWFGSLAYAQGDDVQAGGESESEDNGVDPMVSADSCASSDPAYDFEVTPRSDLTIFWTVDDSSTTVSVKAEYQGEGWLGIGFSDNGGMAGSDSVIGLPGAGTALEYDMPNTNTPVEASEQEITNATVTQAGGVTTLAFVRPLAPTGSGKQALTVSGSTPWIYAWGSSNTFVTHTVAGAVAITLDSCTSTSAAAAGAHPASLLGRLAVLGASLIFPLSALLAQFSNARMVA